jgi:hypothetical protein
LRRSALDTNKSVTCLRIWARRDPPFTALSNSAIKAIDAAAAITIFAP